MRHAAGFTLIELMVALTIAATVAALGAALVRTSIASDTRSADKLSQRQALRDVRRLVEYYWERRAGDGEGFSGSSRFLALRTGREAIRFECREEQPSAWSLWLTRQSAGATIAGPAESAAGNDGERLLAGMTECAFGYLQPPRERGLPAWIAQWPQKSPPPAVVRLDLATPRGALPPLIVAAGSE